MEKKDHFIRNSKVADSGGKLIFENATLCSQFLRDYTGIDALKNVTPEDIEDMTERFIPMFTEERESDVVKRVRLSDNEEFFLITLIEHKSSVDYNVVMQLLRYMVYIWEDYEHQAESKQKGISRTAEFKYPPILPIVYYEDRAEWTAARTLGDRVFLSDIFAEYLPDYSYLLFELQQHEQTELLDNRDEISLIMIINRLRNAAEFRGIEFPEGYLDDFSSRAPEDVLRVFTKVMTVFLRELRLSEDEINDFTDQIKERKMGRLFEHFDHSDPEAREEGARIKIISQVCKKLLKGQAVDEIAEDLVEDIDEIQRIADVAQKYLPEYDPEKIFKELKESKLVMA